MDYLNKTKEELISTLQSQQLELDIVKEKLNKEINDRSQMEIILGERLKELNCHDRLSEVLSNPELSSSEVCKKIVEIIPPSWQFPEQAEASLQINKQVFTTANFKLSKHLLSQNITVNQEIIGQIEVCYPEDQLPVTNQLFLPEESSLLFSIAVKLGNYLEKREKELALNVSEEKYKDLIENISDVIYTTDNQANITFISPSITKLLGYRPEDIIGRNFSNFTGESSEHLKKRFEEISEKSELQNEYQILTVTGEPRWIRFSSKAIFKEGQFSGITGTLIDVTEKKLIALELQKSESLYRSILQASPDTIFIADLVGQVLFTSPMALKMFGYEQTGFPLNSPLFNFLDPKDHDKARAAISLMFEGVFTGATEYVGIKADGSTFNIEVNGEFIRDADGNPTSMVFVTRDITDRKLAEEKLRKSEETYRNLVESIKDIVFEVTLDGTIKYISSSIESLFNFKPESLIGKNFFSFVHPDDLAYLLDIFKNNRFSDYKEIEYRCLTETGETVWVQVSAQNVFEDDRLVGRSGILHDITDQKLAEEKLRKSEEQYRKLVESVNDVIFDIDATGNIKFISQSVLNVLGYTVEEAIGQNIFSFLYPEDVPVLLNAFKNLATRDYNFMEYRYVRKDGSVRWVRSSTTATIKDGEMIGATGTFTDVTERKLAEEAMRISEEKYRNIFLRAQEGIFKTNIDGTYLSINPALAKMYGYDSPEELIKSRTNISDDSYFDASERKNFLSMMENHGYVKGYEYEVKHKDGHKIWFYEDAKAFRDSNGIIQYFEGFVIDITERKLAEETLKDKTNLLTNLIINLQEGILLEDSNRNIALTNQLFCTMFGIPAPPQALIGADCSTSAEESKIFFKNPEKFISDIERILENKKAVFNDELQLVDGRYLERDYIPTFLENKYNGHLWKYRDITERKLAEEKVRESEEKFRMVFENVFDGISIFEEASDPRERKLIECNEQFAMMAGRSREELLEQGYTYSLTKTLEADADIARKKGISEQTAFHGSFSWIRPDGKDNTIEYIARPITWQGKSYSIGIDRDVTEYKHKEDRLRKLSQAVEQSPVSIVITDLEGNIEYANPKACETTGYSLEELKGNNPRVLKSGETPLNEYQYLWDSISNGNVWKGIFHNKRKNGELYWEASQITPITDENGNIKNYLAIKENITERKKIQEDLILSEDRFSQIAEQSKTVIWEVDSSGLYTFVSPMCKTVWGYTPEEIVGKKYFYDLHPAEGREGFKNAALKSIHRKEHFSELMNQIVTSDNRIIWVSTNGVPVLDLQNNLIGYRGADNEITERVLALEDLRQSEERYKSIFRSNHSIMMIIDPDTGDIKDVNTSSCNYYKWSYAEMCSKNISEINMLTPKEVKDEMQRAKDEKRGHFYFKHRLGNGEIRDVEVYSCPLKFGDSTLLYSIVHDITDRRIAEESLFQRERDLNFSQEIAGMGSWQLNMATNTSKWSDNMYRIFGLDPDKEKASQELFFELIHPDDRHLIGEYIEKILRDRKQVTFEMRINPKSGKTIWIQNSMNPGFEGDQLVTLNGTNIDITSKKQAEETLRINEAALNQAQEISKMCSWELDMIAEKMTWSKNYYHLMGITDGTEISPQFFIEKVHPEDRHLVNEKQEEMTLFKKPVTYDIRLRMPDQEFRWIQNNIVPEFEDGILVRFKGVNIDVTEKKLAEESIKLQNERLSAIIGAMPDLILIVDKKGTCLEYYNSNPNMSFIPDAHAIGANIRDLFNEEEAHLYIYKVEECLDQRRLITYDFSGNINNSIKSFEVRLAPMGTERVLTFVRDITKEKLYEAEIKKLSLAVEQSPVIIVITDLKGKIEYVNPAFEAITGYELNEVLGKKTSILKSGETSSKVYSDLWKTIASGNDWFGEWVNKKKNGDLYWENVSITPIRNENGKITNYLAVKQDITQRKQTEKELNNLTANLEISIEERTSELTLANYRLKDEIEERKRIEVALSKSEKSYRTVVENVNEIIFQTDAEGLWIFLNHSWENVTGFTVAESIGQLFANYVHPDDRARNWELFEPLIMRKKEYCRHEIRYLTKDGGFRWIEVFARLGLNDNDEITGTYGTLMDITERRLAEESLKQMSSRLSLALRVGGIGVWDYDVENNILLWDNQMFAIYGIREEDFSGAYEAWQNGLHPDDKIRGDHEIQMAIQGEKEFNTEFRVIWPDGSIHYVRALAAIERDNSGKALRMIGTNWDITIQKQAANFENEMLQLSTKLTGVTSAEIDSAINLALLRIGQFLNADRAYIFEINDTDMTMNNTYEWCNEGIHPEIENLQQVPCDVFPHWMEALGVHENIIIPSIQDLPESWQSEREILEPQGIQSLVVIPLLVENNVIGFVGLDSVKAKREYNQTEMNMLKVWSSMLSSLIQNKRAEGLLEQIRQNYETFFNTIDDFLWVLDEQGNIIHTNNTVENRLEYTREELLNQSVLMVHPAERREEAGRIVGEMLAGTSEFCPVPIVTQSGKQIPVETRVKAGFWNGVPVIFGVSKDISQIQLSEQKFSSAFHSSSSIMTITRFADNQFIDVNNAFVNTIGYSREDIKGQTLVSLGVVRENPGGETVQELIKRGISLKELEVNVYSKSNDLLIFLMSVEDIYIGSERCLLSVAVNITERKIMENDLRKAREEADQANMAKSEFLSRMSHELRTPMNSILGFSQLLDMDELNPKQKKGVNHILTSGKHLLRLIDEVLDISRIEAGKLILSPEKLQVGRIINEMLDSVQHLIASRHIKMEMNISSSDEQPIIADRQRLKQVLLNLLSNAVKYNKEGGTITISTSFLSQSDGNDAFVRISISDTGNGISEAGMAKIFTPFERIGAEKTQTEGTGLGLSVVKKLMDAMGGNLGVESTPGVGSTFWIELPFAGNAKSHKQLRDENIKLTADLGVANTEIGFQDEEKTKRADELKVANIELAYQDEEKTKRADELIVANIELAFQNEEKGKRADELKVANIELAFQNEEKGKRADELKDANIELAFQDEEKTKRADELKVANIELAFQNVEKGKRADELKVANIELAFQNEEKGKRADELKVANIELAFQDEEKTKRANELIDAKSEIDFLTGQYREQATKLDNANKELSFFTIPSSIPNTTQSAKTGTILYIEDNESNIELIQQILADQRPYIQLLSNFTGKETVRMAIDCAADLILLDLDLPDMHGSEVLEQLKADVITKNIPVVIISADAMPHQLQRLVKAGAKDYLTKPLDIIDFLKIVDEFMTTKN